MLVAILCRSCLSCLVSDCIVVTVVVIMAKTSLDSGPSLDRFHYAAQKRQQFKSSFEGYMCIYIYHLFIKEMFNIVQQYNMYEYYKFTFALLIHP